jgi:hypothetical protein
MVSNFAKGVQGQKEPGEQIGDVPYFPEEAEKLVCPRIYPGSKETITGIWGLTMLTRNNLVDS